MVTGVRTGTRLEQLQALRRRIDHEIAVEAARLVDEQAGRRRPPTYERGSRTPEPVIELLNQHGLTALQVKQWAHHAGLIDRITRGRVALDLVRAYIAAQDNRHV